jgi:type I restriction enzyme, S subunit
VKYPPYPRYKPSGIEWLGDVPEHWEAKRLKTSATCWVSNVDKVPSEDELPVRLCNYTDVYYNDYIRPDMGLMETTASPDEVRRFGLRAGDVLITKDSEDWRDIAVPALVEEASPDLVCGYHLAIIRPREGDLASRFLLRALQASAVNQQFQVAAAGVTRYGLPKSAVGDAWLAVPPIREQAGIADFLDAQTTKLDTLVAKKRALIERLHEKRAALISRTVTRGLPPEAARAAGLDPHPRLKPSGIDWLGDVPEHWQVMMVKRTWAQCDYGISGDLSGAGEVRVLTMGNIQDGQASVPDMGCLDDVSPDMLLTDGDLLFNRTNSLLHVAKVGLYRETPDVGRVSFASYLVRLRTNERALPEFLNYQLNTTGFLEAARCLALPSINQANLNPARYGRLQTVLPPVREQDAISRYLDRETARVDQMVAKIQAAIDRLQEYRAALITAAVTGKIDVRGVAVH